MQIGLLAEKEVNMTKKKKPLINSAHYLSAARFDIWIRLLFRNLKGISPGKIPQVIYITVMSLILFPFAILELRTMYSTGKAYKDKKTAGAYNRDMEVGHHQCAVYHVKRSAVRLAGSRKHSYIQQQYTTGLAPEIRTEKNSG